MTTIGYYAVDEREIQYALKDKQFMLSLQPIINISDETFETLEVFIRWKHPLLGVLPPSLFMPRIKSDNLQHQMTDYIIREAIAIYQVSKQSGRTIGVNININMQELENDATLRCLKRELYDDETPENICLELNSRILSGYADIVGIENYYPDNTPDADEIKHLETLKSTLKPYSDIGITLALDTYDHIIGAIERAKILGLHAIKISPTLISKSLMDNGVYLKKCSDYAKENNIALIATGTENIAHIKSVIYANVNYVQGMFLSSPVYQEKLSSWNRENLIEAKRITHILNESTDALKSAEKKLIIEQEEFLSRNTPIRKRTEKLTLKDMFEDEVIDMPVSEKKTAPISVSVSTAPESVSPVQESQTRTQNIEESFHAPLKQKTATGFGQTMQRSRFGKKA